jgi:hypothetical protein
MTVMCVCDAVADTEIFACDKLTLSTIMRFVLDGLNEWMWHK